MRVFFDIEAKHIKRGRKDRMNCCAAALAIYSRLQELFPKSRNTLCVYVRGGETILNAREEDVARTIRHTIRLQRWIRRFDTRPKRESKPARFVLTIPDEFVKAAKLH